MKHNILITGASGTGTSSLGRLLGEALQVQWLDLDDFYWLPVEPYFTRKRPLDEREVLLSTAVDSTPNWVISGSILNWGQFLIPSLTLVVFLTVPTKERLNRIRQREIARFGEYEISEGGSRFQIFQDFLDWSNGYDNGDRPGRSLYLHETWLKSIHCPVLRIDGVQSNIDRLSTILEHPAINIENER